MVNVLLFVFWMWRLKVLGRFYFWLTIVGEFISFNWKLLCYPNDGKVLFWNFFFQESTKHRKIKIKSLLSAKHFTWKILYVVKCFTSRQAEHRTHGTCKSMKMRIKERAYYKIMYISLHAILLVTPVYLPHFPLTYLKALI